MILPTIRRAAEVALCVTMVVPLLGGCGVQARFDPCPDDVTRVEVFNTYADHDAADRQVLTGKDATFVCTYGFPYETLTKRAFDPSDLGQRRITVMRFAGADGSVRTLWIYGLAGYQAGTAIILDTGESFYVPNNGPAPYYAPDAEVIPRNEIPSR